MATQYVYKDAYLNLASNDLSTYVKSLTLNYSYDEVSTDAMGDTVHHGLPGLGDFSIEVEFNQSWANTELDSILWPLVGASSASAVIVKPNGDTTSTSNPKWTGNVRIYDYPPMGGTVGDGAMASITLRPGDGSGLTRATSD
jgi:hypothetical protein